jgi:phosphopantothenoylcysteine synthetase/decarboxylase
LVARGFRGSLAFVHQDIHLKSSNDVWKPVKTHDDASLLFTMCAFMKANPVPWADFGAKIGKNDAAFLIRRNDTKKCLAGLIETAKKNLDLGPASLYGKVLEENRKETFCSIIQRTINDA